MDYEIYAIHGGNVELPMFVESIGYLNKNTNIERKNGFKFAQIIYCTKGEAYIILKNKRYSIIKGTSVYIPAHIPYKYGTKKQESDVKGIAFSGYGVEKLFESFEIYDYGIYKLENTCKLDELFEKIYIILKTDRAFGDCYASGYLYEFLIEYYKIINNKISIDINNKNCPIVPVLDYIDLHYKENIMLEQLCDIINVSPQHLCRLFKKYLQLRPNEYIAKKRLDEAKRLLLYSDKKIYKIAEELGFSSTDYFTTVFKKYENVLPSEYRANNL